MTAAPLPVRPAIRYALRKRRSRGNGTWHLFTGGFGGSLCGLMSLSLGQAGSPQPGPGPICQQCLRLVPPSH